MSDLTPEPIETLARDIREHVMPDMARVLRLLEGERGTEDRGLVSRMKRVEDRVESLDRFVDKFMRPLIYVLGIVIPAILGFIAVQLIQRGP